jgi:hypothetical protein
MSTFHLGADGNMEPFDPRKALAQEGIPIPQPIAILDQAAADGATGGTIAMLPGQSFERQSPVKPSLFDRISDWLRWPAKEDERIFVTTVAPSPPQPSQADTIERLLDDARNAHEGTNPKDLIGATKVDLSVVPPAALLHLASAMMDGAKKYGPFNWRENKVKGRVYVTAMMRHLLQYLDGEDIDPTSGVHHLGHAMACAAILLDARETGNLADDRPLPGAAGAMIRRWSPDGKFG